jgi:hypothetical protein
VCAWMAWEGKGTCCQGREAWAWLLARLTNGSSLSFRPIYTVHTYRRVSLFPSLVETWEATDDGRECVVVSPLCVGPIRFVSAGRSIHVLLSHTSNAMILFKSVGRSMLLYAHSMPDKFTLFGFKTHIITYTHITTGRQPAAAGCGRRRRCWWPLGRGRCVW